MESSHWQGLPPAYSEEVERAPGLVVPLIFRGASRGFIILVAGELAALALAAASSGLAAVLLALVGAVGPAVAGVTAGREGPPGVQGGLAGLGAYLLTVPLRLMVGGGLAAAEVVVAPTFAAAVGGLAGRMAGRTRPAGP